MISEQHRHRYRVYHSGREFPARNHTWRGEIDALVKQHKATSVLDYGSGPSKSLAKFAPYPVISYDPGVAGLDLTPEPADIVVCNHVLEHVEPEHLDATLEQLRGLTIKAAYIAVSCKDAPGKVLHDGTPWHTIVQSALWWDSKIRQYFYGMSRGLPDQYIMVANGGG
jgi:hypothetical protein